jgi:hypothetical protein
MNVLLEVFEHIMEFADAHVRLELGFPPRKLRADSVGIRKRIADLRDNQVNYGDVRVTYLRINKINGFEKYYVVTSTPNFYMANVFKLAIWNHCTTRHILESTRIHKR